MTMILFIIKRVSLLNAKIKAISSFANFILQTL